MRLAQSGAGTYRERITIQQLDSGATEDAAGEVDETADASWITYANQWAAYLSGSSSETKPGDEHTEAKQVTARSQAAFRVRFSALTLGITTRMRVSWKGRIFNIINVENVNGRNEEIFIGVIEAK